MTLHSMKTDKQTNDEYVAEWEGDPWYPAIKGAHDKLTELIPGYHIEQIKEKFWFLRYYFTAPRGTDDATLLKAYEIVRKAEDEAGDWREVHAAAK